jgi:hypothetical protein
LADILLKKQRKQLERPSATCLPKGSPACCRPPAVPLPTRSSAKFGETDRENLACCPDFKLSHDLLGDFVVAPMPDALPSLIVRREEAPSAGATGSSSNSDHQRGSKRR